MSNPGPIYEVTLITDPEIAESFDLWLGEHIEEMLQLPGFSKCNVYDLGDDEQGWTRRVCQYHLETEADLSQYLAGPAENMRQSAVEHFGDRFTASRRVLQPADIFADALPAAENCRNCGAVLNGQYCAICGQRGNNRLISILELTRDAFGDIFELDSRLWRTLLPLLTRPGRLTRDYLEGRRARYMPPFRTYLVLSILFFFASFFEPEKDFGILFEPGADDAAQGDEGDADSGPSGAAEIQQEIVAELAESGIVIDIPLVEEVAEDADGGPQLSVDTDSADCDLGDMDPTELPPWLAKRFTRERLQHVCESVRADDGGAFLDQMKEYVPAALIILLPIMALMLKLLYPLSKRYYVEHLLFVVHFHAFFFLILTLQITISGIAAFAGLPDALEDATALAAGIYIPVYLYKAMRRVYGQGRFVTLTKFIALAMAYLFGLTTIFVFAAVLAAFAVAA
jgi:hypothetical protein